MLADACPVKCSRYRREENGSLAPGQDGGANERGPGQRRQPPEGEYMVRIGAGVLTSLTGKHRSRTCPAMGTLATSPRA